MAERRLKIGTTLSDALGFTFGNFGKILGMTWMPMILLLAFLMAGVLWILDVDLSALSDFSDQLSEEFLDVQIPEEQAGPGNLVQGTGGGPFAVKQADGKPATDAPADEGAAEGDPQTNGEGAGPDDLEDIFADLDFFSVFDPVRLGVAVPILLLGTLILQAVPLVGYTRTQLRGKAPILWPFYFRLGPTEVRLAISLLLISLIVTFAMAALLIAVVISAPLLSVLGTEASEAAMTSYGAFILLALLLVVFVFVPWLWSRLAMAVPVCVNEGGLGIRKAWRMTSGHGFTLTVSAIIGFIIVLVISSFAQFAIDFLSLPLSPSQDANPEAQLRWAIAALLPIAVAFIALQAFQNAFLYGIFTGAYKQLTRDKSA